MPKLPPPRAPRCYLFAGDSDLSSRGAVCGYNQASPSEDVLWETDVVATDLSKTTEQETTILHKMNNPKYV